MPLPDNWEYYAEQEMMGDIETALDDYFETSVSDIQAARFTWREFLEKGEQAAPGSLDAPFLIFHVMGAKKNAQLAMSNYRDMPVKVYLAISLKDDDGVALAVSTLELTLAGIGQAIRDAVYTHHDSYTLMQQPEIDSKSSNPANQVFTRFLHPLMAVEVTFTMTGALASDLS